MGDLTSLPKKNLGVISKCTNVQHWALTSLLIPILGIPEEKRRNEQSIEFVSIPFTHGSQFQQIHNLDGLTFNYEWYHTVILSLCSFSISLILIQMISYVSGENTIYNGHVKGWSVSVKLCWTNIEWNVVLETLVELFKLELLKTTNLKTKKLKKTQTWECRQGPNIQSSHLTVQ